MVMVVMSVAELAAEVEALDIASLSRDEVTGAYAKVARLRAWLDLMSARLARRMATIAENVPSMLTEAEIAEASKTSRSDAGRTTRRAKTLDAVPELEAALEAGDVSAEHVDAIGRAMKRLKPELRERFAGGGQRLAEIAARSTPEEFDAHLKLEVVRLDEREGTDRLARQKQRIRLRSWTDRDTGMVIVRAEYDPESGLVLLSRIDATVETMFHTAPPQDCPDGEGRHDYLRAAALLKLVERRNRRTATDTPADHADTPDPHSSTDAADASIDAGASIDADLSSDADHGGGLEITEFDNRCEMIVVIDLDTLIRGLHDQSIITNGYNIDLPLETYRRMACLAAIIPIVLDTDGVALDEGRQTRLASRKQRRALRAMYDTCAIPGCTVGSRHCEPHHIRWWRHWGKTDLNNLLPLCSGHHHAVHEGGWQLVMHPDRSLTITYPDGVVHETGPPAHQRRRKQAA